jgi:type IV fimbrial biogenesis protein FimT
MNKPHAPLRRQRGVSLVEILITCAILAGIAGMALPAIQWVTGSMRLTATANELLAHLHLARSESIKRNGRVALCKSINGEACASGGGWQQGWIVFHDRNGNGVRDVGEVLVQKAAGAQDSLRVSGNATLARYVSFVPSGETQTPGGGFQAGTITLCHASAGRTEARQIIVSAVGRPRVHKTTVAACA